MTKENKSNEFAFIKDLTAELSTKQLIFPTSLNVTMRIRHALNDPDSSIEKVARIVGTEPVLSAQLLGLCNSAAVNTGGKSISDLRSAIPKLGFSMVRNIAISVGMRQLTQSKTNGEMPPVIEGLWTRSVRLAALAYVMAKKLTRLNPDTAMLVGLLHDVGKFYILNRARNYPALFANEQTLWEIVDHWHSDIGEAILESWEIPEEISMAVRELRNLKYTHVGGPDLTDVIISADFLDAHFYSENYADFDENTKPEALTRLKLDFESSTNLMSDAKEELGLIFKAIR